MDHNVSIWLWILIYSTFNKARLLFTTLIFSTTLLFSHILLIKGNSVFINHLQWYWIRHYVFDWFIRLIIIKVHETSAYSGFIYSMPFLSVTRKQEREWMSKQSQKLSFTVKESFVKLVNSFRQSQYIVFGHFILSTVLFSLQISN